MLLSTYGDLARQVSLGRHSARMKADVARLSTEMTTGVVSDKARHLSGDMTLLAGLEKSLVSAATSKLIAQRAEGILAAQQSALGAISVRSETIYLELLQSDPMISDVGNARKIAAIETAFEDTVRFLNTTFSGRSVFSGTAGDGPALASAQDILQALAADLPPASDSVSLSAHVDLWFAEGGGFDSVGFLGGEAIPSAHVVGGGNEVRFEFTAQAAPIRQTLAGLAKGALLSRGVLDGNPVEQSLALDAAASSLMMSQTALVDLSARIGMEQENAARGMSAAEAEQTSLAILRAELVSADPYETATQLEEAMSQLELIYTLTARLSRLTLADFLR